jgi:hypothetical protein
MPLPKRLLFMTAFVVILLAGSLAAVRNAIQTMLSGTDRLSADSQVTASGDVTQRPQAALDSPAPANAPCLSVRPGLPETFPADTAGIGGMVERYFPEYRLSSEDEIVCRLGMNGMDANHFWPEYGLGSGWWVWQVDLDGDGREDLMTILTDRDDSANDLLVVFLADGGAHAIVPLRGSGVRLVPAGDPIATDEGVNRTLNVPAIGIIVWEKGGSIFAWEEGAFRMIFDR